MTDSQRDNTPASSHGHPQASDLPTAGSPAADSQGHPSASDSAASDNVPARRLTMQTCIDAVKRSPLVVAMCILGIIGFVYSDLMQGKVFPTASIDLKYSRKEILSKAEDLAKKFGYSRPDMIKSIDFSLDNKSKVFLERTFGQTEANRLMQDNLPIWFWWCTFKKEFDKEYAIVQLSPTGQLIRYSRELENDLKLPSLSVDQAKEMAVAFAEREGQIPVSKWDLVKSKDETQVNRVDHSFEWEEKSVNYKGAHRRVRVNVCGNIVGTFWLYLHTPESFDHSYATMRSYNELLGSIASMGSLVICLGTIILFVRAVMKKAFSIKAALLIGAIYGLALCTNDLNSFPSWGHSYPPSESYASYLFKTIAFILVGAVFGGTMMAIVYAVGQPVYRQLCPTWLPIKNWFSREILRSPQLIQGIIVGIAFCGISRAYQISYYLLGDKFGYWCPLGLDSYQVYGDALPFVFAVDIGIQAATAEEGLYRIMGLGMFQRIFRGNFWVANFVQAVIWGFMHSGYPQQPAYARGVELTLEGLFDGWLLARFGLIPCLVSHYFFDALCCIEPLRAAPPSLAWTAAIPLALPVVLLGIALVVSARKGLIDDTALIRSAATEEIAHEKAIDTARDVAAAQTDGEHPHAEPAFSNDKTLSIKWRCAIGLLALISLMVALVTNPSPIGEHSKPLNSTRKQAVATARKYFADHNIDLRGYNPSVELRSHVTPDSASTYMNETVGLARTREVMEAISLPFSWRVRFTKPLSPYEYTAFVDQDGKLTGVDLKIPEDAPGANLSQDEARRLTDEFIKKHRPIYEGFRFIDAEKEVREKRTDYRFSYEVPKFQVADAKLKLHIEVVGDQVSDLERTWQVPDKWKWAYERKRPFESELNATRSILFIACVLAVLWLWIECLRAHLVTWRAPLIFGAVYALVQCASIVNELPSLYLNYQTDQPRASFLTQFTIQKITNTGLSAFLLVLAASVAFALIRKYLGKRYLPSAFSLAFGIQKSPDARKAQRALWFDSIMLTVAVNSVAIIVYAVCELLEARFAHQPPFVSLPGSLEWASSYFLPISAFASAANLMVTIACAFVVVPGMFARFLRGNIWVSAVAVVVAVLVWQSQMKFLPDYLLSIAPPLLVVLAVYLILWRRVKQNFLAVIWIAWSVLVPPLLTVYRYAGAIYMLDFVVLLAVFLSPLAYLAYVQLAPQRSAGQ